MRILVTGSEGFIGKNLMSFLKDKGHTPIGFDIKTDSKRQDVRNINNVYHYMEKHKIEAVCHHAALPRVMYSIEHPQAVNNTNLVGTLNLLDACVQLKVKRFVFASSCSVYGDCEDKLHEEMPLEPLSPYAASKVAVEAYLSAYNECYGINTVALRYSNVYGDGMNPKGEYALVIGKWLEMHNAGKTLPIYGDGTQTRDFVHVYDVCKANLKSIEGGIPGVYNIGRGQSITLLSLARMITYDNYAFHPPREGEVFKTSVDISKARRLLHYSPKSQLKRFIKTRNDED